LRKVIMGESCSAGVLGWAALRRQAVEEGGKQGI